MEIIYSIFQNSVTYTIPLLMAALGCLVCERSGVTNLCIEGLMLMGCFVSALTIMLLQESGISFTLSVVLGIIAAMAGGVIFSLLYAFAAVNLKADQIISGIAVNMLASSLTVFMAKVITGAGNIHITRGIIRTEVPLLSEIPVIGPLLFSNVYWTTYLCLLLWGMMFFLLYRTSFGLRLRGCGEHPSAVASAGINVIKMRYLGVMASGLFSGLAGVCVLVTYAGDFNATAGMNGLGFLAIAAMIFGHWNPLGILGTSFFFGFCMTVSNMGRVFPGLQDIPTAVFGMFPYIATLIALVFSSRKSSAPKACGRPF